MAYDLRTLEAKDTDASWDLGAVTFGYHGQPRPDNWSAVTPGRIAVGAFDSTGQLVARAVDRVQDQWFGGRPVPTSGVAGVAVAPYARRGGLGRLVLTRLLADARSRGAAISTLFPTTALPYRALGWEEVGALTYTAFPASSLAQVKASPSITLRPATVDDFPAIHALYAAVASASTGMLDRAGPCFTATAAEALASVNGFTVAVNPDGEVCGYASWDRGPGYDATGKLTVYDLIASSSAATASLLAFVGNWASVTPTAVLRLTPDDPARYLFSQVGATVEKTNSWMLRIVDAVAAIAARGWPSTLDGRVSLALSDPECPWNAGDFVLTFSGGKATLEPGGSGDVAMSPRGLALWYAGVSPAVLRRAGFLSGDTASDALLQTATAGPPPSIHDYF
ncbi:GNAT family N-acetyltransferase [Catelliglobosispora koreensis]|uniref:GNAT family N-acetyltransferase n=1 Tax=Catelliglobosispora koreensis TaxID=129052 RepID=UPI0003642B3D|nr:GNAT family N-acetyltransferase [Catelliglobosispora koreensis]